MKNNYIKKRAFTLVELIIVITILAILATIAFVSFQSYNKSARDSNRLATLKTIQKGIELFQTQTGNVPNVDDKFGTGTINSNAILHIGYVGNTIAQLIKLDRVPTDPSSNTRYVYGVDYALLKYQIASISEQLQTYRTPGISLSYADAGLKANVLGNYQGLLKYSGMIFNIPSFIVTFSGAVNQDLAASNTNYVIDKGENLPYLGAEAKSLNTLTPTQVLQKLTNTGAALVVTGVTMPTDAATWQSSSATLQTTLGYSTDVIGKSIFGERYYTDVKNAGGTPFSCGDTLNITVSGVSYSYTTKLGPDGKCWTSQNMVHGTMLANGSTLPSNTSTIEKWCYSNDPLYCNTDGALYTRAEAMGFPASCNTSTCSQLEDTSKSVCGQLGSGWGLPTDTQWNSLTGSGATGWLTPGNKLSGLVNSLPGYCNAAGGFANRNAYRYGWVAKEFSATNAYDRHISSAYSTVSTSDYTKTYGFSVICVKN